MTEPGRTPLHPVRWLVAVFVCGFFVPIVLALLRVHEGAQLLINIFGLPIAVIATYLVVACRRIFKGRSFWTLFRPWHLFLIFAMPVLLYAALAAAFYTRLMIAFGLSFL